MAKQITNKQIQTVFVSDQEMATLLGAKAQEAGFITFSPDDVDMDRATSIDNATQEDVQGWAVQFIRRL